MGLTFSRARTVSVEDNTKKSINSFGQRIKASVEEEIGRRMMIQREVQMAINIARARDNIQIFGSLWAALIGVVGTAKLAGKPVPGLVGVPIVAGGVMLGNLFDVAYGNKMLRVAKEAEHILDNERSRLVPMKQAPMARFYTAEEKSIMFDPATPAAGLFPSSTFSRSFIPKEVEEEKKE